MLTDIDVPTAISIDTATENSALALGTDASAAVKGPLTKDADTKSKGPGKRSEPETGASGSTRKLAGVKATELKTIRDFLKIDEADLVLIANAAYGAEGNTAGNAKWDPWIRKFVDVLHGTSAFQTFAYDEAIIVQAVDQISSGPDVTYAELGVDFMADAGAERGC